VVLFLKWRLVAAKNCTIALVSLGSPIFSAHVRKEGEPGIQCHKSDVIGRVMDCKIVRQQVQGAGWQGVANKLHLSVSLVGHAKQYTKAIFHQFRVIHCAYESLRCLLSISGWILSLIIHRLVNYPNIRKRFTTHACCYCAIYVNIRCNIESHIILVHSYNFYAECVEEIIWLQKDLLDYYRECLHFTKYLVYCGL
jgi:hypothetical protein